MHDSQHQKTNEPQEIQAAELKGLGDSARRIISEFVETTVASRLREIPDAVREELEEAMEEFSELTNETVGSIELALLDLEENLNKTIKDQLFDISRIKDELAFEAYKQGSLEQLLCQHLDLNHIVDLAFSALWQVLNDKNEKVKSIAQLFLLDPESSDTYKRSWRGWVKEDKKNCLKIFDLISSVFNTEPKLTKLISSYSTELTTFVEGHVEDLSPELSQLIDQLNITLVPIAYGDQKIGMFAIAFFNESDKGKVQNTASIVSNAMAAAYARVWRVEDRSIE